MNFRLSTVEMSSLVVVFPFVPVMPITGDNEGHIMIKMTNNGDKDLFVEAGKGFAQGIFLRYYLTDDDAAVASRTGGFGSTG